MKEQVAFKGTINGIILQFKPELSFAELYSAVEKKLEEANFFFKGANVIGVEGGSFSEQEEAKLARLFNDKGGMKLLSLEKVSRIKPQAKPKTTTKKAPASTKTSTAKSETKLQQEYSAKAKAKSKAKPTLKASAEKAKVTTKAKKTVKALPTEVVNSDGIKPFGETIIHRGTLRSGSVINSSAHIVLLGDANPGSELTARGNIIVWGSLRGLAHAGSAGDTEAFIIAENLQPTQIRISSHITRPPDDSKASSYTEIAMVENGQIVIKPYK